MLSWNLPEKNFLMVIQDSASRLITKESKPDAADILLFVSALQQPATTAHVVSVHGMLGFGTRRTIVQTSSFNPRSVKAV
jgi:hypothetical protein